MPRRFGSYQAYLNVSKHPALFTVLNADTCERLHFLVPFDSARAQAASDRAVTVIEATPRWRITSFVLPTMPPTGAARCVATANGAGHDIARADRRQAWQAAAHAGVRS